MQVLSITTALPRTIDRGKAEFTAIDKLPVAGAVQVTEAGIVGDAVGDTKHHGGPDQAIYVYGQEDLDWWASELDMTLPPGLFGENLLVSGLSSHDVCVDDRFTIGERDTGITVVVTAPREPCQTFARKMAAHGIDSRGWVKRFNEGRRRGFYVRVLSPGQITVGDAVHTARAFNARVYVETIADALLGKVNDTDTFNRILAAEHLGARQRAIIERRLPTTGANPT